MQKSATDEELRRSGAGAAHWTPRAAHRKPKALPLGYVVVAFQAGLWGEMPSSLDWDERGTGLDHGDDEFSSAGPTSHGSGLVALSSLFLSISVLLRSVSAGRRTGLPTAMRMGLVLGSGVSFRPILSHSPILIGNTLQWLRGFDAQCRRGGLALGDTGWKKQGGFGTRSRCESFTLVYGCWNLTEKRHFAPLSATGSTIASGGVVLCKFNGRYRMGTVRGVLQPLQKLVARTTDNWRGESTALFTMFLVPFFHGAWEGDLRRLGCVVFPGREPLRGATREHAVGGRNPFAVRRATMGGREECRPLAEVVLGTFQSVLNGQKCT